MSERSERVRQGLIPGDGEIVEAVQLGDRHLGVDEDAVLAVGALEAAGDLVQLVQARALGVGDEQLDLGQRLLEGGLDPLAQRVEALARRAAETSTASGWRERDLAALLLVEQVGLVEDQQPRLLAGADLLEHLVDRAHVDAGAAPRGSEASTTCRIRSASTVSSSVALKASTSWWGSFSMKPTVSVSR